MLVHLRPALVLLALFGLLTGGAYPLIVTGIAQAAFPRQAQGSLLERGGQAIGSRLIGQAFASDRYFHGRPSAAGSAGYDAGASSGSNYGPTSKALRERIAAEAGRLKAENPDAPIPADLVYASGSGLDPHISWEAAQFQAPRIARARGLAREDVLGLISRHAQARWLGLFGERTVNVLELNLALDQAQAQ